MKIKKIEQQNISDLLINYGNLSQIYPFLVQEQIPYIKKGQLTKDFYTIKDTWINQDSTYLTQNNNVVVNNDDIFYYPTSANSINFINKKVDSLDVAISGSSLVLSLNYTNYGYLSGICHMEIELYDSTGSLYSADEFDTNTLVYLESSSTSISFPLPISDTYIIEVFQTYSVGIKKNIYKKTIIL
jgi:hypothetical protein